MDLVFKMDHAVFNYRVAGIWIENGHVLLHKQVHDQHWALPGGRVAFSEESQVSLKREFREELDVDIRVDRLVWVSENFFEYDRRNFHELGFYYLVSSEDPTILKNKEAFYGVEGERLIYKWMPIEELRDIELLPKFLKTALTDLPKHVEHFVEKPVECK